MSNPAHGTQFDLFLATISDLKPQLLRNQENFRTLRKAALKAWNLADNDTTVITHEMLSAVFMRCRKQLQFKPEAVEPVAKKPDYGLSADGRPRITTNRSLSATEKEQAAAEDDAKRRDAVKGLRSFAERAAERHQRDQELNQTILYPNGRVDYGRTQEARRQAAERHRQQDKERGITNE
jgi:hypothetical protein